MKQPTDSILVVDDNSVIRQILRMSLEADGYTVDMAENGVEALEKLQTKSYNLVLLDIMMPKMNGIQVLEVMRQDSLLAKIPVIVISANHQIENSIRCIELGAVDYLSKPINRVLLKIRVDTSLEKKRLLDQERKLHRELEALYAQVQEANQAKNDFIGMVAHELRTPMTALWGAKDLLARVGETTSEQDKLLANMDSTLERMRLLVSDLDDISRIESGNLKLLPQPLDFANELALAIEAQHHQIAEKGHRIKLDVSDGLLPILADRTRLMQILTNILNNAVKYTPPQGEIEITAVSHPSDPAFLSISVKDNGIGICAEAKEQVFEKFFRVDSQEVHQRPGSGLGLHIVQDLVGKHGGQIGIESNCGQGTIVSLTLPFVHSNFPQVETNFEAIHVE